LLLLSLPLPDAAAAPLPGVRSAAQRRSNVATTSKTKNTKRGSEIEGVGHTVPPKVAYSTLSLSISPALALCRERGLLRLGYVERTG